MPKRITVECPDCGNQFDTHDIGDKVGCEECRTTFPRFSNIVEEA